MALIEKTKLSNELNYRKVESTCPVYRYMSMDPTKGAASGTTVSNVSGVKQTHEFTIDTDVRNEGESYLEYDLVVDSQGANFLVTWEDTYGEIENIMYRDNGNQKVVDVQENNSAQKILQRLNRNEKDLRYADALNGIRLTNEPLSSAVSLRYDGNPCNIAFNELREIKFHPASNGAATTIRRKVYLKDLVPDSFFGEAKDELFPVKMKLIIDWTCNNLGFGSTSANAVTGPLQLIGNTTINNLKLRLALEANQALVAGMIAETAKGRERVIPWIQVNSDTKPTTAVGTFTQELEANRNGFKIQKIITAIVPNAPATPNLKWDHSNIDGARVTEYETYLNGAKLQRDPIRISATEADDYMLHKKRLVGTLYYNKDMFRRDWLHVESFDYCGESNHNKEGFVYTDGHPLVKSESYKFKVNKGANDTTSFPATFPKYYCIVKGLMHLKISQSSFLVGA